MPEEMKPEYEILFRIGGEWRSLGKACDIARECVETLDRKITTTLGDRNMTATIKLEAPRIVTRRDRCTRLVSMNVARYVINRHLRDARKEA